MSNEVATITGNKITAHNRPLHSKDAWLPLVKVDYTGYRLVGDREAELFFTPEPKDRAVRDLQVAVGLVIKSFQLNTGTDAASLIATHIEVLNFAGTSIEIAILAYRSLLLDNPRNPWVPTVQDVNDRATKIKAKIEESIHGFFFSSGRGEHSPFADPTLRFAVVEASRKISNTYSKDKLRVEQIKELMGWDHFGYLHHECLPDTGDLEYGKLFDHIRGRDEPREEPKKGLSLVE